MAVAAAATGGVHAPTASTWRTQLGLRGGLHRVVRALGGVPVNRADDGNPTAVLQKKKKKQSTK